jgi:hypothetical protein
VERTQVFELAYEGIAASSRHKSGIALRFPRILRRRIDKPAEEADKLSDLQAVLEAHRQSGQSDVETEDVGSAGSSDEPDAPQD